MVGLRNQTENTAAWIGGIFEQVEISTYKQYAPVRAVLAGT